MAMNTAEVPPGACHLTDTRQCSSLRVKASCGHIAEPLSLKTWAKTRIDTGIHSFPCQSCKKEWAWQEVCRLALFTEEERESYERKLVELTKEATASYKKCPYCNFLVQRMDAESLCVECLSCSTARGKPYQFCWDCMREWQTPASGSTDCGNTSCTTTAMLLSCPLINAPHIEVHECPVIRACPNCQTLVSHCQQGCPQVECPNCFHEFCYRCLGIEDCNYAECVELTDDDDTDYEDFDEPSACIRAGRQKITERKSYKINSTVKQDEDATGNAVEVNHDQFNRIW